nr:zinc finger, CCHC-type [Tanacetum cinerariifolium]
YMGFTYESKTEIWVTKVMLDEAKNILGLEIFRNQSRNTRKKSLFRFSNEMSMQILIEGHFTLSLKGGLSGNLDEAKKSKGSCIYEVGCHENQGFVGHGICGCEYVT